MKAPALTLAALAFAGAASAQEAPAGAAQVDRGAAVFQHWCAPCHAKGPGADGRKMLAGTWALTIKYKGEKPGALEDRTDLPAPALKTFLRTGSFAMPAFRKTEVSDADIEAVAAYLQFSSGHRR
jgi:mono/diheme cytochrome c family protein